MTAAQNDFIRGIATILNIRNEKIIKKGVELIALLELKSQLNCSATCKGVICLDIASSFFPEPIKKEDAIKYSGCKKNNYLNMYNNFSKLLNLIKLYSVKEVCLLANVCDVREPASKLLDKFKSHCNKVHYDFDHPMYSCAAVWAICRQNKIRVNHGKLIELSRLKRRELDKLTKNFEELIDMKKTEQLEEKEQKSKKIFKKLMPPPLNLNDIPRKKKQISGVMTDEEYEEWKKKMLEE